MIAGATDSTALATNRGTVEVRGKSAIGIFAYTRGAGTAQVVVDGGTVRASYDSTTNDAEDGVGILARTVSGSITARIQRNSLIEAPLAARFLGGPADVIVDGSTIRGAMVFDRFNDSLSVINSTFSGDIDFGGGLNTLVVQSSVFDSTVTGVSELFVPWQRRCPVQPGRHLFRQQRHHRGRHPDVRRGLQPGAGRYHDRVRQRPNHGPSHRGQHRRSATDHRRRGIIAQDVEGNLAELEIYIQADETVDEETRGDQATIQRAAQNVIAEDTPVMSAGNAVALKNEGQGEKRATIGSIPIMEDDSRGVAVVQSGAVLNTAEPDGTTGESCLLRPPRPLAERGYSWRPSYTLTSTCSTSETATLRIPRLPPGIGGSLSGDVGTRDRVEPGELDIGWRQRPMEPRRQRERADLDLPDSTVGFDARSAATSASTYQRRGTCRCRCNTRERSTNSTAADMPAWPLARGNAIGRGEHQPG